MIHGHKPNGHFFTFNQFGNRVEGETHMCVHCQTMWTYKPGSGIQRGYCLNCGGFICGRQECQAQQKRLIELMRDRFNQTRSCVPFEEWNDRLREKLAPKLPLEPGLTITESGLIVPTES